MFVTQLTVCDPINPRGHLLIRVCSYTNCPSFSEDTLTLAHLPKDEANPPKVIVPIPHHSKSQEPMGFFQAAAASVNLRGLAESGTLVVGWASFP